MQISDHARSFCCRRFDGGMIYGKIILWILLAIGAGMSSGWCASDTAVLVPINIQVENNSYVSVNAIARQPDGKIIIGGDFKLVNYRSMPYLARLNPNGTVDATWNPAPNSYVYAIAVSGTNIYVAGDFSEIGGTNCAALAKLDYHTGALVPEWTNRMDGCVYTLAISGTNLFVGGSFTEISGVGITNIAKISSYDGTPDPSWNGSIQCDEGDEFYNKVCAVAANSNAVFVGGWFTNISGHSCGYFAKLNPTNGAPDLTWTNQFDNSVNALALSPEHVYAGGWFTNVNGNTQNYLARCIVTNGQIDGSWAPNPDDGVNVIGINSTNILIGGDFMTIGGFARPHTARLSTLSSLPIAAWTNGPDGSVYALTIYTTNVFVGGAFNNISGSTAISIAKVHPITGADTPDFNARATDAASVYAVKRQADGKIILGGKFTSINGTPRRNVARLNSDFTIDATWNPDIGLYQSDYVQTIAIDAATNIYVGGSFYTTSGTNHIIKIKNDGTFDALWTNGAQSYVSTLCLDDTNLFAGGNFISIGGMSMRKIAKLETGFGLASTNFTNASVNGAAHVKATLYTNNALFACGNFTNIGGGSLKGIAKLDAETGLLMAGFTNQITSGTASCLALTNSELYVAGAIYEIGGISIQGLARLDADSGALDMSFSNAITMGGGKAINTLLLNGSNLYVGGLFTNIGEYACKNLGRINRATGLPDTNWAPESDGAILAVEQADHRLLVGGSFTNMCGVARYGFAVLTHPGPDVYFSQPTNGQLYTAPATISMVATAVPLDGLTVTQVVFYRGALPIYTNTSEPYSNTWTGVTPGVYYLSAQGWDSEGERGTSAPITIVVGAAPLITNQPQSCTSPASGSATFHIGAAGTQPLFYQWAEESTPVAAATNASYTINPVSTNLGTNYHCIVSNAFGVATSATATLTVTLPPVIDAEPVSTTNVLGSTASFIARSFGQPPLFYRWHKDGSPLAGQNASTCLLVNVAHADVGDYHCLISNVYGSVTSRTASLTVVELPTITTHPGSLTLLVGNSATFSVTATGTQPLGYQWQKNGAPIGGATGAAYSIAAVVQADAGNYRCVVANNYGTTNSQTAVLTVNAFAPGPGVPGNVTASAGLYRDKILVSWLAGTNATGHRVYRATNNITALATLQGVLNTTQFGDTNVIRGCFYYYWVQSYNAVTSSAWSTSAGGWRRSHAAQLGGDYDGDGFADPAVYGEPGGDWKIRLSGSGYDPLTLTKFLGGSGDVPAVADYDGDNFADPAVYNEATGNWKIMLSGSGYATLTLTKFLGGPGFGPAVADYDGDNFADPAVYNEATGNWKIMLSGSGYATLTLTKFLGGPGFGPAVADYDNDRLADPTVYKETTGDWQLLLSSAGYASLHLNAFLGGAGCKANSADYDGDGKVDCAVYDGLTGKWTLLLSSIGYHELVLPHFLADP